MDISSLITFTLALSIAAVLPGPGIAAIVARSLASGSKAAMPMVLGLMCGDLIYLTFAVLGLAVIAQSMGGLFVAIKWAGIAYLLYLAWKFWTSPASALSSTTEQSKISFFRTWLAGLSVTLGNPKTITFYLALTPTIVDIPNLTILSYFELVMIVFAVISVVLGGYIALAARARSMFVRPAAVKRLNRFAALAMAGAAVGLASRN